MTPCLQAVLSQSPFDPTPHVIVKYHISEMNFVNVMIIILIHPPPINLNLGTIITTNNLQSPTSRTTMTTPPTMITAPPKSGSPGSLGKISPSLNITRILPDGSTTPKPYHKHQSYDVPPSKYPSKPLTAFSLEQHSHHHGKHPNRSGSAQSRASTLPPGHIPINLQEGSKEEWVRQVKYALTHPDRMRAGKSNLMPRSFHNHPRVLSKSTSRKRWKNLAKVDSRIPTDIGRKAIHLLSSTGILTDFDLSTCYVRELPQTGMLALVIPLPEMQPVLKCPHLLAAKPSSHGHLPMVRPSAASQLILMEGKIRPANWSYHKNPQRCGMPSFGAFYLGRQIANADKNIPSWAEQELLDSMEKKGKGQQEIVHWGDL